MKRIKAREYSRRMTANIENNLKKVKQIQKEWQHSREKTSNEKVDKANLNILFQHE